MWPVWMDEGVAGGGGGGGSGGGALSDRSRVTAAHQHLVHAQFILNMTTTAAQACASGEV